MPALWFVFLREMRVSAPRTRGARETTRFHVRIMRQDVRFQRQFEAAHGCGAREVTTFQMRILRCGLWLQGRALQSHPKQAFGNAIRLRNLPQVAEIAEKPTRACDDCAS